MQELIPLREFDEAVEFALREVYLAELIAATPKKTRITSTQWKIKKVDMFKYEIQNDYTTGDGKYTIVELLEFGTRPHEIRPVRRKALHWQKGSKDFFATRVHHPGFEARRFIQRTLDNPELAVRFEKFVWHYLKQKLKF